MQNYMALICRILHSLMVHNCDECMDPFIASFAPLSKDSRAGNGGSTSSQSQTAVTRRELVDRRFEAPRHPSHDTECKLSIFVSSVFKWMPTASNWKLNLCIYVFFYFLLLLRINIFVVCSLLSTSTTGKSSRLAFLSCVKSYVTSSHIQQKLDDDGSKKKGNLEPNRSVF